MNLFFNNEDRIRIKGRVFFRGQRVIYNYGGDVKIHAIIDPTKSLICYYFDHYHFLPLREQVGTNFRIYEARPSELEIITPYKEKTKGGSIHMPRIIKWGFYLLLLVAFWRLLNPALDLLLKFLQQLLLKS